MTTSVVDPHVETQPRRRLFTVDEYYAMADAGILTESDRVELIDGEIIVMSPIGDEHAASVDTGTDLFAPLMVAERVTVRVQAHLRLGARNQPEPDLMLLKRRDDFYRYQAPGADDVLLLIEVSDTSPSYDRSVKLALYARFNIPEVWIANIPTRVIEVYTNPVDGEYTASRIYRPGETVSPTAFDDVDLPVSRIIGTLSDDEGAEAGE